MKHVQKIAFPCLFFDMEQLGWGHEVVIFEVFKSNIVKVVWVYISVNEVNIFGINEVNGVDIYTYRHYAMQGSWRGLNNKV